jgi:hypothetical protein
VVFYAVPPTNPPCFPTVFTDRFWDQLDGWSTLGVGTVPGSLRPYFGQLPPGQAGHMVGSREDFANGLLYSVFQAGGYPPPCGYAPIANVQRDKGGGRIGGADRVFHGGPFTSDGGGLMADAGDEALWGWLQLGDGAGLEADQGDEALWGYLQLGDGGGLLADAGDTVVQGVGDLGGLEADAGDEVFALPVGPGLDCDHAGMIATGVTYGPYYLTNDGSDNWFVVPVISGQLYSITLADDPLNNTTIRVYEGADCASAVFQFATLGGSCNEYTAGADDFVFFDIFTAWGPTTYTITVNLGPC